MIPAKYNLLNQWLIIGVTDGAALTLKQQHCWKAHPTPSVGSQKLQPWSSLNPCRQLWGSENSSLQHRGQFASQSVIHCVCKTETEEPCKFRLSQVCAICFLLSYRSLPFSRIGNVTISEETDIQPLPPETLLLPHCSDHNAPGCLEQPLSQSHIQPRVTKSSGIVFPSC